MKLHEITTLALSLEGDVIQRDRPFRITDETGYLYGDFPSFPPCLSFYKQLRNSVIYHHLVMLQWIKKGWFLIEVHNETHIFSYDCYQSKENQAV